MEFPEPIKYRMSKNSFDIEPQGSLLLFQLSIADVGFSTDADGGKDCLEEFYFEFSLSLTAQQLESELKFTTWSNFHEGYGCGILKRIISMRCDGVRAENTAFFIRTCDYHY